MKAYLFLSPFLAIALYYLFGDTSQSSFYSLTGNVVLAETLYYLYLAVSIFSTAVVGFIGFLIFYYFASDLLFRTMTNWEELLREAGVPEDQIPKAIESFKQGRKENLKVLPYSLSAPVICAIFLPFVKWDAEAVPRLFWQWDNNVNMNGDNGKVYPGQTKQVWHHGSNRIVTLRWWQPLEDNEEARALCYWAKGHHPRSFYARWIWLGLRNRAKAYSQFLGRDVVKGDTKYWGDLNQDRGHEGARVLCNNGVWQMARTKKIPIKYWPGKSFDLCLVQNFGYKIGIVDYDKDARAMPVYVMSSIKGWRHDEEK